MMTRLCILLFRWFAQVLRGRQFRSSTQLKFIEKWQLKAGLK